MVLAGQPKVEPGDSVDNNKRGNYTWLVGEFVFGVTHMRPVFRVMAALRLACTISNLLAVSIRHLPSFLYILWLTEAQVAR